MREGGVFAGHYGTTWCIVVKPSIVSIAVLHGQWGFSGCWNVLLGIDHLSWLSLAMISRGDNGNGTVARCFPILLTVHWKYIVVIGWTSLLLKHTWGIALFLTVVFLVVVLLLHIQHVLLKTLSRQRGWHGTYTYGDFILNLVIPGIPK